MTKEAGAQRTRMAAGTKKENKNWSWVVLSSKKVVVVYYILPLIRPRLSGKGRDKTYSELGGGSVEDDDGGDSLDSAGGSNGGKGVSGVGSGGRSMSGFSQDISLKGTITLTTQESTRTGSSVCLGKSVISSSTFKANKR